MAQNERKGFFSRLFNRDNQKNEEKQLQQEKQIEQENKREEKTKAQPTTPDVSSTVKTLQRLQKISSNTLVLILTHKSWM